MHNGTILHHCDPPRLLKNKKQGLVSSRSTVIILRSSSTQGCKKPSSLLCLMRWQNTRLSLLVKQGDTHDMTSLEAWCCYGICLLHAFFVVVVSKVFLFNRSSFKEDQSWTRCLPILPLDPNLCTPIIAPMGVKMLIKL